MAPKSPKPTVNIPATPPARNASLTAARRPDSRAAFAVRTFARTASHMPTYPVIAEKLAPEDERDGTTEPDRERRVHRVLGHGEDEEQRHADDDDEHGQGPELP